MQLYPLYGYNSEWMLADRILAIKKTLHRNETGRLLSGLALGRPKKNIVRDKKAEEIK
jgi:hypothetical protein